MSKTLKTFKPLSFRQFGSLRFIRDETPYLAALRGFNQITLWSLLKREYVYASGMGGNRKIYLTDSGKKALSNYTDSSFSSRLVEDDITERVQSLLTLARIGPKTASAA
jgi:hypothetical protein